MSPRQDKCKREGFRSDISSIICCRQRDTLPARNRVWPGQLALILMRFIFRLTMYRLFHWLSSGLRNRVCAQSTFNLHEHPVPTLVLIRADTLPIARHTRHGTLMTFRL